MKYLLAGLWAMLTAAYFWVWNTAQVTCCVTPPTISQIDVTPPKIPTSNGPLVFNWASGAAITSSSFPAFRDSILKGLGKDDKLEIVGLYNKEEENTSSFENMGLARANATKNLLLEYLPEDRMILKAKLQDKEVPKDHPFASIDFRPLHQSKSVVEIDDYSVIYFPLNSASKLNSQEVEQYLDKVAEKVKKSGETIELTGHTCDRGDAKRNMALGKKRANIVAKYLISKGVPKSHIVRKSKGETEPMVPNTSEENRVKNRRTVLKILKNTKTKQK